MPPAVGGINRRSLLAVPMQPAVVRASGRGNANHVRQPRIPRRSAEMVGRIRSGCRRPRRGPSKQERRGWRNSGGDLSARLRALSGRPHQAPPSRLPMRPLTPHDAWVYDPADGRYNRLVTLPYPARTERLWRDDQIYDLVVGIGYNMEPVIAGAGSAIFLHIARPSFSATEGCTAVGREVLTGLIPLLGPGSTITIGA